MVDGESLVVQEDKLPYFYNVFHKHEQIQITAILSGKGELITRGGDLTLNPKKIFIIGSNQPHLLKSDESYYKKNSKNAIHAIHIYFKSELILHNFNLPEFEEVKRFINRIGTGLMINETNSALFISHIKNISKNKGIKRIFLFIEFLRFCYFNIEKFTHLHTSEKTIENFYYNNKTRVNDIYAYTLAHFTEEISLTNVAKVANMTVPAMCKYFKKSTRKTYMEFLKEVRIDYSCKKIVRGDFNTVADIAYSAGFRSTITFNRAFKSLTGKTPTEYLQAHKKNLEQPTKFLNIDKLFIFH